MGGLAGGRGRRRTVVQGGDCEKMSRLICVRI